MVRKLLYAIDNPQTIHADDSDRGYYHATLGHYISPI